MRFVISALFIVGALTRCHAPSNPSPSQPPVRHASATPFRPLLITTFGANTSSDGSCRVTVFEQSVEVANISSHNAPGSTSSNWTSTGFTNNWRPGWFVYIEHPSRVWAYDGDRNLFLRTYVSDGINGTGAIHSANYPSPVPAEVFSRLSDQKQKSFRTLR